VGRAPLAPGSSSIATPEPCACFREFGRHFPSPTWRPYYGNIVVHEQFGVTSETLWKTAREDLPAIIEPLRKLLSEE
jgi:uncharacterized protein with HEPN domain